MELIYVFTTICVLVVIIHCSAVINILNSLHRNVDIKIPYAKFNLKYSYISLRSFRPKLYRMIKNSDVLSYHRLVIMLLNINISWRYDRSTNILSFLNGKRPTDYI